MNNIKDLNIEKEILPLFDYSMNMFSRNKILEILGKPLQSTSEITQRQNILKGFSKNQKILKDYSYTVLYLNEVHFFLNDEKIEDLSKKKLKYKLFASKQEKTKYTSKLNQLILFFYRLESKYFTRLRLEDFPKDYVSSIKQILEFLSSFELHKFEHIIREKRLKDNHVIELTEKINELKRRELIRPFWEALFLFESYLSINIGIIKNNLSFPTFTKDKIGLRDFYHPLLENPVKNNLETNSNVIVLNGPNMSGKSTFLKAVGLCMYFGHLGIGIPASKGEIPFCDYFSIEINRRDDILNGYSHFMTEVMNLKKVVEQASNGKKCFAIFDELFSGTNVEDGFEICKTTINGLSKFNKSYFFISTHIQELKNVSNGQIENYYIDCELIENIPTFTYQLKKGWSDIKVGRILFEKEGLNKLLN
ncbi:MutS-related protein [Croceivirga radicis]|uniref:MutS-related protein n=1 Tax=Croceivirga radicis TaxID=1929488 RepID=UPI000255B6DA|nr:DNA mismatch repair protein MutS domain-containing protein [Croceivirga radicis]